MQTILIAVVPLRCSEIFYIHDIPLQSGILVGFSVVFLLIYFYLFRV